MATLDDFTVKPKSFSSPTQSAPSQNPPIESSKKEESLDDFTVHPKGLPVKQPQNPIAEQEGQNYGIGRNVDRQIQRAGEQAFGLAGNVESLINTFYARPEKEHFPFQPGKPSAEPQKRMAEKTFFPTSQDLREMSKKKWGNKYEPQTHAEKKLDDFTEDLTNLVIGPSKLGPVKRIVTSIGQSIAGNLVQEGIRLHGGGEKAQNYGKIGTWLLTGMLVPHQTSKQLEDALWNESRVQLPQGADMPSDFVNDLLENVVKDSNLGKGSASTAGKSSVLKFIDEIKKKGDSGRINIDDLIEFKKDANSFITELIAKEGLKPRDARKLFKPVSNAIGQAIEQYGVTQNKPFLNVYKQANQVSGALAEGNKVSEWLMNILPFANLKVTPEQLFGVGGVGHLSTSLALKPETFPYVLGGYVAAAGTRQAINKSSQIINSPVLRKHYLEVISNAAKQDSVATIKSLHKLDNELAKNKSKEDGKKNQGKQAHK